MYNNHSQHVQQNHNTSIVKCWKLLTNSKKEIDVTKNGKNFLALQVQSPSVQLSRVQASRSPESKRTVVPSPRVHSPSVQSSKVQDSRVQGPRPYAQSPASPVYLFKHCHSSLNAIYIATGFVTMSKLHFHVYSLRLLTWQFRKNAPSQIFDGIADFSAIKFPWCYYITSNFNCFQSVVKAINLVVIVS